jgi:hypothetical protein
MKIEIAVMVVIETDDPRLTPEAVVEAMTTASGVAGIRRVVLGHLPDDVTRVLAVMDQEQAELLMMMSEGVGRTVAQALGLRHQVIHPPADYIPPTRD